MRQEFQPRLDYEANRGFRTLAQPKKPGFFPNFRTLTKSMVKTRFLATRALSKSLTFSLNRSIIEVRSPFLIRVASPYQSVELRQNFS
jgi:hypothetical protein